MRSPPLHPQPGFCDRVYPTTAWCFLLYAVVVFTTVTGAQERSQPAPPRHVPTGALNAAAGSTVGRGGNSITTTATATTTTATCSYTSGVLVAATRRTNAARTLRECRGCFAPPPPFLPKASWVRKKFNNNNHNDNISRKRRRHSATTVALSSSTSAAGAAREAGMGARTRTTAPVAAAVAFGSASLLRARGKRYGARADGTTVVAEAELYAESRPQLFTGADGGDGREERASGQQQQHREEVVGATGIAEGVVLDPTKVKLGKGKSESDQGLEICRVINALCQDPLDDISGDPMDALRAMDRLAEAGLTTFQLGNGSGGGRALAERRAGSYLKSAAGSGIGSEVLRFLNMLSLPRGVAVTRRAVEASLELSLSRMGVERLDLVQLCWQDFEDRYFLDALYYLEESEYVSNVGVSGFPSAAVALAGVNGLKVASNLVTSSLIKAPAGSSSEGTTLAQQCKDQGVAIISSGASLGGFAAEEWLYRSFPNGGASRDGLSLASRKALSDVVAWGSGGGRSRHPNIVDDAWRLYQSKLLPGLQDVARKHGDGLSPADVAIAFLLYRKPLPSLASTVEFDADHGGPGKQHDHHEDDLESNANKLLVGYSTAATAAAVSIPVKVCSAGSLSMRRLAEADEDRIAGRRGAELAELLDGDDLERIAAAIGEGVTTYAPSVALDWEKELLGGADEQEDDEELWDVGTGWEGPNIFL